ncbi:hypothetical protein [Bacillus thuringiensis]|uniref:hypothetical protein n=1 Tax=Bacillus thuringiensis TaxID=1428 RepID=UPI003F6C559A
MALQQRKYMKKSRRNLYIALEELDLVFDESEVTRLQEMWKENKNIIEIAKELGKHHKWLQLALGNGIHPNTFYTRVARGWGYCKAATKPARKKKVLDNEK